MEKADTNNILKWIDGMDEYNSTKGNGTTRVLFTKEEIRNRQYIKGEMESVGLTVKEDDIGNIFATLKGTDSTLAPVWTGSHIDTVPNAGKFDGMAGVVAGLEALRIIKQNNIPHKRDIVLVVYTSEEPTRYGLSCLGSRAMTGELDTSLTKDLRDADGRSLYEKLKELGYNPDNLESIRCRKGDVYASVELHIEQNSQLEKSGDTIGVVSKICAPSNFIVTVKGCQSHAGGTSMADRRDAFMASSEMALSLEKLAKDCKSEYNTATIGCIKNYPDAVNVIPGKCTFSVDLRDCNKSTKDKLTDDFTDSFTDIAAKRGVSVSIMQENDDTPLTCNKTIIEMITDSCNELNLPYRELISGPYHDTLFVGKFAPSAMIFVPSRNGISHSKDEWTDYKDIASGADVLCRTLIKLSDDETEL